MDIVEKKGELFAPRGSYESRQAAIEEGCEAVYIGGSRFGARAYAENLEEEKLLLAIDYAHIHNVAVYLTVNTLFKEEECKQLIEYLMPYYRCGIDAIIVQDLGVMRMIEKYMPELPIHASTQMSIWHADATQVLAKNVNRIVPARELSIAEIREMKEQTDLELEIFVHGALCYSYSGQCLMSSMIGGRSGNRGRCAQPCRKSYDSSTGEKGYWLSPKDQCLLENLEDILEIGVHSLKIEGRMKRMEYAAQVTAIYRKWIDRYYELGMHEYKKYKKEHLDEMKQDIAMLADLYNRGGFCRGYAWDQKGPQMMASNRPNHTGIVVGSAKVERGKNRSARIHFTKAVTAGDVIDVRAKLTNGTELVCAELTIGRARLEHEPISVTLPIKHVYV